MIHPHNAIEVCCFACRVVQTEEQSAAPDLGLFRSFNRRRLHKSTDAHSESNFPG